MSHRPSPDRVRAQLGHADVAHTNGLYASFGLIVACTLWLRAVAGPWAALAIGAGAVIVLRRLPRAAWRWGALRYASPDAAVVELLSERGEEAGDRIVHVLGDVRNRARVLPYHTSVDVAGWRVPCSLSDALVLAFPVLAVAAGQLALVCLRALAA